MLVLGRMSVTSAAAWQLLTSLWMPACLQLASPAPERLLLLQVGVKHIVFSGLEDTRAFSNVVDSLPEACPGYKIPPYECKAQIRVRRWRYAQE